MATVSVCIVTYNSAEHIVTCLKAVQAQSHPIERVVIVDNASVDNTCALISSFVAGQMKVQLIYNKVNNGFAGGHNQTIHATDTDYVVVLNPDVSLHQDYISEIITVMEREQQIGSATGQLLYTQDTSLIDSTGLVMNRVRQAKDRGMGEQAVLWEQSAHIFGVSGAAAVYARRMIRDLTFDGQFFDEHFFAYKEDVDVAWRGQRLGWRAYYVSNAKALHGRGWKKGGRSNIPLFVRQHSYMNRFYTLVKNEPFGLHWLTLLPLITIVEAMKLVYIVFREPALLRCIPQLLRTLPDMVGKRSRINKLAKERISNPL